MREASSRLPQIVSDENDGFAKTAGERREFTLKFGAGDGSSAPNAHPSGESVIGRKGAGNADALTLAAGELTGCVRNSDGSRPPG